MQPGALSTLPGFLGGTVPTSMGGVLSPGWPQQIAAAGVPLSLPLVPQPGLSLNAMMLSGVTMPGLPSMPPALTTLPALAGLAPSVPTLAGLSQLAPALAAFPPSASPLVGLAPPAPPPAPPLASLTPTPLSWPAQTLAQQEVASLSLVAPQPASENEGQKIPLQMTQSPDNELDMKQITPTAEAASMATPSDLPRCHLHKKPNPNCKRCKQVLSAMPALSSPTPSSGSSAVPSSEANESTKASFQCSPMLRDQILKSSYFKSLLNISNMEALVEEIDKFADGIDVYQVGSPTSPSVFFCCAYRVFTLEPTEDELRNIIDHLESALVRCVGFIYMRFTVRPDRLWEMFEEYLLDDMELQIGKGREEVNMTIGEYVETLLMKEKYFGTPLPRVPVVARRKLEEHVAPLLQHRKRMQVNRTALSRLREEATPVEVCRNGVWQRAQVIELVEGRRCHPARPKLRVRVLDADSGDRSEVLVHIGCVVLSESSDGRGRSSRSRSRGRRRTSSSPDWLRWKGKSDEEMVRDLREKYRDDAVCASGKDYARRPVGFEISLAMRREQGSQESRMNEEDSLALRQSSRRKTTQDDDVEEREKQKRRKIQEEGERQRKLTQIFEKYGGAGQAGAYGASRSRDVEGPDVMRLG